MRCLLILSLVAALFAVACVQQDPAPVLVDISYQVRCLDCSPRAADDNPHTFAVLDGDNGYRVACSASPSGKSRLLSFSAVLPDSQQASGHAVKLVQANLDGTDSGPSCRVIVVEGGNTYQGSCTNGGPTPDLPCQVKLKLDKDIVTGSVLCNGIPNSGNALVTRHVVKPNTDKPATFELHGCTGL